jgi:hypothetical protein
MAKIDSLEASLLVNGKAKDVFELVASLKPSDWRFQRQQVSQPDLLIKFGFRYRKSHLINLFPIEALIEQQDPYLTKIKIQMQEAKVLGASQKAAAELNAQRRSGFSALVAIIESSVSILPTPSADIGELDDVAKLMDMTDASGSSDAATMRLIEIAKHHEESGNQVEALLILAPMAAKYCIPAIDALTRISAEKGDMAGLQSWSTQKAQALQIVSSGKGSPVSGVPRSILPQLAALGFVATNMNLIGIKNELGEISAMADEEFDSGDSDSGFSDSFGDFF